jgi:molecular chaperone GrpE
MGHVITSSPEPEPAEAPKQLATQATEAEPTLEPPVVAPAAMDPPDRAAALLVTISETVERLAASSERYHARAQQREGVIDHLHSEVDLLRRGERRGLLRPLLVQTSRLRNDLLRQAEDLPHDFDAERARVLLRSYAESVELTLEDNGVVTFAPEAGDPFEPRLHRRVGGEPTSDPALVGRVARVRRSGYLDSEANMPIAPAEVVLFVPVSDAGVGDPGVPEPASTNGERKES